MVDHDLAWLLGHFVQVSPDRESKSTWRGKITGTTESTITVTCPANSDFHDYTQEKVQVKIFAEDRVLYQFETRIKQHFIDPETKNIKVIMPTPQDMVIDDIRQKHRTKVKIVASLHLLAVGEETLPLEIQRKPIKCLIRDLSETGAQILSPTHLPRFSLVNIIFHTPDEGRLSFQAKLKWSQAHEKGYQYGFEFIDPDLQQRSFIRKLVYKDI